MLYIIMLAAGYSKRFHENKLLYRYKNQPLYWHTLNELIQLKDAGSGDRELIVVTQYEEIGKECEGKNVLVAYHKNNNTGMASSIEAGIKKAEEHFGIQKDCSFLFCVADQPNMKWSILHMLIQGYQGSGKGIGSMGYWKDNKQILANPVVFHCNYRNELLQLKNEEGGKVVLKKYLDDVFVCHAEQSNFFKDIDSKDDL